MPVEALLLLVSAAYGLVHVLLVDVELGGRASSEPGFEPKLRTRRPDAEPTAQAAPSMTPAIGGARDSEPVARRPGAAPVAPRRRAALRRCSGRPGTARRRHSAFSRL